MLRTILILISSILLVLQYVAPRDFNEYTTKNLPLGHRLRLYLGLYNKRTAFIWYVLTVLTFILLNTIFRWMFGNSATFGDYRFYEVSFSNLITIFIGLFMVFWILLIIIVPLTPIFLFAGIITLLTGNLNSSVAIFGYILPPIISAAIIRYVAEDARLEYLRSLHSTFGIKEYRREPVRSYSRTVSSTSDNNVTRSSESIKEDRENQKAVFCSSCGSKIRSSARFCPKCGELRDFYKRMQEVGDEEALSGKELSETRKRLKREVKARQKIEKKQDKAASKEVKKEAKSLMDNSEILLTRLKGMLKARRNITMEKAAEILEVNQPSLERFLYDAIGKDMIDFNLSITPDNELKLMPVETVTSKPPKPFSAFEDPVAEQDAKTCMICKTSIRAMEDYGICPHCDHEAHSSHFREWLKLKDSCPVCKETLELKDVIFFNAKKKT